MYGSTSLLLVCNASIQNLVPVSQTSLFDM
jgi:hypothetical protein